ncbi:MAG: class C sortase [Streptococcaceae bacterium]|jgi:sortase A|nr:class C sortase [Streptococcaceae bacterium]
MKGKFLNALSVILVTVILAALFYPIVANVISSQKATRTVTHYQEQVSHLTQDRVNQLMAQAKDYNAYIYAKSQHTAFAGAIPNYDQSLNVDETGMMGYLSIPQIQLKSLPIYHHDDLKSLELGAGHMAQTSLPIGGVNTHAVLSAHSGRDNASLFTDLDKLKLGDTFNLHVLDEHLTYKIIQRDIVTPEDVSKLSIEKGKDLVTLITCYPTGVNSHRLLVTGERVPWSGNSPQELVQRNTFGYSFWVILGSSLSALAGLVILMIKFCKKSPRKETYAHLKK